MKQMPRFLQALTLLFGLLWHAQWTLAEPPEAFLKSHCTNCHSSSTAEAGLNLETLSRNFDPESIRRWIRVHDRLASGEMPPRGAMQPSQEARTAAINSLSTSLLDAEKTAMADRPGLRRLTRSEYENTIRDVFDMPGIALAGNLPADGQSQGFDKHPEALDISHVNVAKYLDAADQILNYAIATRPEPPAIQKRRISLVNRGGFVAHIVMNGDGILIKDGQTDPTFPPAAEQNHLDQGAHERWGSFSNGASVGLFRHEDESVSPYFMEHVTIYPAKYRVRTSLWSFQWDQGKLLPGRGTEAARLSVVQLTGDGRGGQHPSYVLGYFNAPDTRATEHEVVVWLNPNEIMGFNTASLAPAANYYRKKRALEFTGPGIVVDWLDIEGPLYDTWPPASHQMLFGNLPLKEFQAEEHPGIRAPRRLRPRQIGAGMNRPDPEPGIWTVSTSEAMADAERLLANVLPKLFRRPVSAEVREQYADVVRHRLAAGDCFEDAMRAAWRNALVSPDFLMHIEGSSQEPDDYALACRLSYLLWNSLPDDHLRQHAAAGDLRRPELLHAEIERLLADPRSSRFLEDFSGQWLKLHQIAATDPDRKLYPEFSPYLQDSMVAETRTYLRELLDQDLSANHLIKSDFVMINQKLAEHYGIPNVTGTQIRRVPLPGDCPRGGFLTQASILKITSNGTTTSPVPRGAFVIDRLLGEPPEPPPVSVSAIEPDVRGATTIREQLQKHRDHAVCASCHQRIDPPGFAMEAFDVIGGFRTRYRSIGEGDPAERGAIDPMIGISFKLGKAIDSSGELSDGRAFQDIRAYQTLVAADSRQLLTSLAKQLAVYATGRSVRFTDRAIINGIVERTEQQNGGIRTLLHELIGSPLFTGSLNSSLQGPTESSWRQTWMASRTVAANQENSQRFLMTSTLSPVTNPAMRLSVGEPAIAQPTTHTFHQEQTLRLRVHGLFVPERVDAFREFLEAIPEVRLLSLDFETAEVTIQFAADSEMFRNANTEQITERLNNHVRQQSMGLFSVIAPGSIANTDLQRLEFEIIGLDCLACSLAVHDILASADGVVHAKASFRDGRAAAWIDPRKTDRMKLIELLRQRGISLPE